MEESDYIAVSELTRIRDALDILCHVAPANVGSVTETPEETAEAEWLHILSCLSSWTARLEVRVGAVDPDDEPERRQFPWRTG